LKLKIWAAGLLAALPLFGASTVLAQDITAAGATFPYPIYSRWFTEYSQQHPGVKINYQSIGSGGGIKQVTAGTVDFGASDGPMSDAQLGEAKSHGVNIVHIPTVLGAVVPIYNLPGVNQELKFSQDALAGIYLGKITKWNDPYIAKENPGVNLPDKSILVVHRSDGSGTTYIFTDFLSKVSPEWAQKVGKNTAINWPVGIGQKGNEGIAGMVRQAPGSIGYVELIYALQNKISFGLVQSHDHKFLKASTEGVTAAAAAFAKQIPADYRVSITDAPGPESYPISSFTWLLIPSPAKDHAKGKAIQDFLYWMLEHGESEASSMSYAPLPKAVADRVHATVEALKY
jgi:phosphate transport system substrate-binding protein